MHLDYNSVPVCCVLGGSVVGVCCEGFYKSDIKSYSSLVELSVCWKRSPFPQTKPNALIPHIWLDIWWCRCTVKIKLNWMPVILTSVKLNILFIKKRWFLPAWIPVMAELQGIMFTDAYCSNQSCSKLNGKDHVSLVFHQKMKIQPF